MKKLFYSFIALVLTFSAFAKNFEETLTKDAAAASSARIDNSALTVKVPKYIFSGLNTNIELVFNDPANSKLVENNYELFFIINGEDVKVNFNKSGVGTFTHSFGDNKKLDIYFEDFSYSETLHIIPLWYILAPIGLLVVFLGYKLVRSGKKNKAVLTDEILAAKTELSDKVQPVSNKQETPKKEKVVVKEVVEKEEEMFA